MALTLKLGHFRLMSLGIMRYILITLFFLGLASVVHAQVPDSGKESESQQTIKTLYADYSSARYAVSFELNDTNAAILRSRLSRFWYLLLYVDGQDLTDRGQTRAQFGFFKNREEAEKFVDEYQSLIGGLTIRPVSQVEHLKLMSLTAEVIPNQEYYWVSPEDLVTRSSIKALMEKAKDHYVNKRYLQAVRYYRVISLNADFDSAYWARELMALCYEKMGDGDKAIDIYERLLDESPEAKGAKRVAQRLRALETRADDGKDSLRKSKYKADPDKFFYRGGIGQTMRYVTRKGKNFQSEDVLAIVSTNLDARAGLRTDKYDLVAKVNGYNYIDTKDQDNDRTRIKQFLLDYTHKSTGLNAQAGRIRNYQSGVYSPFNGISVRYPLSIESMPALDNLTIGINYGEPEGYSEVYDQLDREFFSLQAEYKLGDAWQLSGYYIEQTVFGETDRNAYGGEVRYLKKQFSAYANFDYDFEFAELNNFLTGATYTFKNRSYVSARYGRQRTPFLSTSNILIGQPGLNLEACIQQRSDLECEYFQYFALIRSSTSEHGSINYSRYIDDDIQLSIDAYQSVMSDLPVLESTAGGAQTVVVADGDEYRYSSMGLRLIASSFFGENDTAIMGLRYADTTTNNVSTVQLSERFRFGEKWIVSPKFYLSYRENKEDDDNQTRLRGSLSLKYRVTRSAELFAELGREDFNRLEQKNSIESNYFYAGYSLRF